MDSWFHSSSLGNALRSLGRALRVGGPSETQILIATGLLVGLSAGVGAVVFRYLIQAFGDFFFGFLLPQLTGVLGPAAVILIPAIGGAVFGPLIYFFAREAKGHGVPEVMMAVALRGGRIRPAVAVVKSLASALCIGSGGSVGREGPIVQIGSALGSTIGQTLKMSDDRIRTLVACGAAGGIAATFNAPIAGVFFALEIILGEFTTRAFGIVVIAAVTASVVGRLAFGNQPAFPMPAYELVNVSEFALYAALGVVAAFVGVGFTRILYWFEDRFDDLPIKEFTKPIAGGLVLGAVGLLHPQIFGVGYEAISAALNGDYGVNLLLILLLAKTLAVALTIGSGGSGGIFAPSLFLGAMLGTAFGRVADALWPAVTAPAGAYGLVGMAAVFSGAARAPITAVIILFELTGDYLIILPLMTAVVVATLTSEALNKDTIYTLKLRRRGIDLRAGRDVDLMRSIPVARAMTPDFPTAARDATVAEAGEQMESGKERALVVMDEKGALAGIVALQDVERALLDNKPGATLEEIASRPVLTAYPDESLSQAVARMGTRDLGQLPVVSRDDPKTVIGLLTRGNIVRAYSTTMLDRLGMQQRRRLLPRDLRGTRVVELTVKDGAPLAGCRLAELSLPADTLVIAVERNQKVLIPHGDTALSPGDRVTILVRNEAVVDLHERLAALR